MNNSSVTPEELVRKINDELAQLFIPAIVFTSINMVTGLVGNLMVCYYYGFKAKRTPTAAFILVLAMNDLITCTVTTPHEIVFSLQFYTYSDSNACKIVNFISYFVVLLSGFTLPAIAIDRYRHIYFSNVYQTTMKDAMKQCAVLATIALLFSWPTVLLHDKEVTLLPIKYGLNLQGTSCSRIKSLKTYNFVVDVVYLLVFFISLVILVVLYFRISKVLYIHRKQFRKFETNPNPDNHHKRVDRMTAKITIAMTVTTTVFFLSFIPRLTLLVWRSTKGKREDQFLSGTELLGYEIGRQSYMLHSSLNPWIYGIFNSEFRQFNYMKLCKKCRHSRDTAVTSTELVHTEQNA